MIAAPMLRRLDAVFEAAAAAASHKPPIPYVFAGAHNSAWKDSLKYAEGIGAPGAGRDCSSALSIALRAGGLVWEPRPPFPLSTTQFIEWGLLGWGELMTMAVQNNSHIEHCALHFDLDIARRRYKLDWDKNPGAVASNGWFQGAHTGTNIGWINLGPTAAYELRHWKGT